jgi:hypothetical protein
MTGYKTFYFEKHLASFHCDNLRYYGWEVLHVIDKDDGTVQVNAFCKYAPKVQERLIYVNNNIYKRNSNIFYLFIAQVAHKIKQLFR